MVSSRVSVYNYYYKSSSKPASANPQCSAIKSKESADKKHDKEETVVSRAPLDKMQHTQNINSLNVYGHLSIISI